MGLNGGFSNVGIAMIKRPPFITIFMGGINHMYIYIYIYIPSTMDGLMTLLYPHYHELPMKYVDFP